MSTIGVVTLLATQLFVISRGMNYFRAHYAGQLITAHQANERCLRQSGDNDGMQLASIHMESSFETLEDVCSIINVDHCWIGLILNSNIAQNTTYTWFDGTVMEKSLIQSRWCDGYPLFVKNNIEYTYQNYTSYTLEFDISLVLSYQATN